MELTGVPLAVLVLIVKAFRETVFDRVIAARKDDDFLGGGRSDVLNRVKKGLLQV